MGMPPVTLRVTVDAERPWIHSHAERGNDQCVATKQGISGRFHGLFFRPPFAGRYISKTHNQMNKYDLWIYKSTGKVTSIEARSQPANRL
ncbi:hypothetical protein C1893_03180 [Pseudomonas sp. MPR-ANC1]|nr:hypothetical protein C1893_03180 [Pseudomonas sp. MPR-ANC1]